MRLVTEGVDFRKYKMNDTKTNVEQAWYEYQAKLFLFIRSKVDTPESAEDILNDVFLSLIKKTDDNDVLHNVGSWLYHVTKHKIVDYYRTKKTFEELPDDLTAEHEDVSAIRQLSACILPMIKALPSTYQAPLILSEIEGKKYKTVADELGLTLAATKSRILRGRGKLRNSLISCCTLYRDSTGNIVDYKKNRANICQGCKN